MHLSIFLLLLGVFSLSAAVDQTKLPTLELRIYHIAEGKVDAQVERFEKVADKMFHKHGFAPLGYWLTTNESKEVKLVYVLATPSREASKAGFKTLVVDAEFREFYKISGEKHGTVTKKVDSIFLSPATGSPQPPINADAISELRLYTVASGKKETFLETFPRTRLPLFKKHGIQSPRLYLPEDQAKFPDLVVALVGYPNAAAVQSSKDAYHKDPQFLEAEKEWNKNGPLTSKVESHVLYPLKLKTQ